MDLNSGEAWKEAGTVTTFRALAGTNMMLVAHNSFSKINQQPPNHTFYNFMLEQLKFMTVTSVITSFISQLC